jgi:chromosome segregation protein
VFLKALTLKGFKSFADSTTLTLEPGVTVVVGPNGSGKSNVVDAIAWVLGAQAPSAVRSQKMDDVIFAGTAKRPALGRAEVSLTLDNSSGLLPIDFTEVTITRTLFRTGESEYQINGAPVRLLDVQDLLSDSGVGRQQHVIVSQGQIDAVLNSRPEDRRGIIEEAAGILKYRKRKERAERRLDATEGNLLRVQDLLREVRRQLRPLERQAEAAKRHGAVVSELGALRMYLAGREVATHQQRQTALADQIVSGKTTEAGLRDELNRMDGEVAVTERQLADMGGFDLGDQLTRAEQLTERARGLSAVLTERRRSLDRDRGRLMDTGVVANLEADAARLVNELNEVEAGLERLGPEQAELAEAEAELALERTGFEENHTPAQRVAGTSAAGAAAEVRGEMRTLRSSLDRATSERNRLAARLSALEQRTVRLQGEIERYRGECEQSTQSEEPLVTALAAAEAERASAGEQKVAAEAVLRSVQDEHATWSARADALAMALDAARARAGAERLADVAGVVGTLLDLVDIDPGWETAFEAAAGEALSAVVVDGLAAARLALSTLHQHGTTGAVLSLDQHLPAGAPPLVGEPVRSHVRSSHPAVSRLLDGLIGSAVAVDGGWEAAMDIAITHHAAIVVTREGDRFGHHGWRVGVTSTGATGAALEEALTKSAAAAEAKAEAEQTLAAIRTAFDAASKREQELTRQLDVNDTRFSAAGDALNRSQAERREATTEVESLAITATELDERIARDQARIAELEVVLPDLEANENAEVARARTAQAARMELDRKVAQVAQLRKNFEVRGAGLQEKQRFLQRRAAETEARLAADVAARDEAQHKRGRIERAVAVIDRLLIVVESRRVVLDGELAELQQRRRLQSEQARVVSAALEGLRRQRNQAGGQLAAVRDRIHKLEVESADAMARLEATVEMLRRDLDTDPETAMQALLPELAEGVQPEARVRDLERELRIMGPINPLALEEFTALQERNAFLETQLEDVKATRRELAAVIKAVDTEIEKVFTEAYADVAANFETLFAMLFPGGHGKLILTVPDDMLRTGIEVEAKPSGKNVKKLSLLSGGERSLTALAFLFAVFRSRPSPFYVMDEVEAALDDVNLHRFLGLVNEFRSEAQLLIVSHQKRTMETGDCLFGVTMQPGGSSKIVSEKVSTRSS